MTFYLPLNPASDPNSSYDITRYLSGHYAKEYLVKACKKYIIIASILALSVFMAINQILLASYGAYAKEFLQNPSVLFVQGSMALAGIGLLLGAAYVGNVSRGYIETGVIPVATIGITLGLFLLPYISAPVSICCLFLVYGFFTGMLIVPLNSLIQFNAQKSELGKTLAASNFIQNIVMVCFLIITIALVYFGVSSRYLMYGLFLCAFMGTVLPQSLIRYILYLVVSRFYRINVEGLKNIPSQAGVLLLGNHASFIDWAILQIASPRPLRFVMERSIYEKWYLHWFLKKFKIIPIARGASKHALKDLHQDLNNGEAIVLLPEGRLSLSGQLGQFQTGFERAAHHSNAVIIPFYLLRLWGSQTSRSSKAYQKNKHRHVTICFGKAMPASSKAGEVRQAVKELSHLAWHSHANSYTTLPKAWLEQAKGAKKSKVLLDANHSLSQLQLMQEVTLFKHLLHSKLKHENRIALLIPAQNSSVSLILSC